MLGLLAMMAGLDVPRRASIDVPPLTQSVPAPTKPDIGSRSYRTVGHWRVLIDDSAGKICFMLRAYPDGSALRVGLVPGSTDAFVMIVNPDWHSLVDGRKYPLTFQLNGQQPWDAEASGYQLQTARIVALTLLEKQQFFADIASHQTLDMLFGGKRIAQFALDGALDAERALAECQKSVEAIRDPFGTVRPAP